MSCCLNTTKNVTNCLLRVTKLVRFSFLNTKHVLNNEALTVRHYFMFSNDSSRNSTTIHMNDLVLDSGIACRTRSPPTREEFRINSFERTHIDSFIIRELEVGFSVVRRKKEKVLNRKHFPAKQAEGEKKHSGSFWTTLEQLLKETGTSQRCMVDPAETQNLFRPKEEK